MTLTAYSDLHAGLKRLLSRADRDNVDDYPRHKPFPTLETKAFSSLVDETMGFT